MSLIYLWKNREKPIVFSARWYIVWIKRFLQFYPLIRISARASTLKFKGAKIGSLAILGKAKLQGRLVNLEIGDQVALGRCNILLHDTVTIAKCVVINDGVIILTASHKLSDPQWAQKKGSIIISEYAWIATNAIILPGVTIGRGAVVGAGAVVRENVPDYAVVIGNPSSITKIERTKILNYSPVLFNAPFEAWIGRNMASVNLNGDLL